ncbi:MAG TPA: class I SAM-dependent methyltransferase [Candidatus Avoscillospira stercoripullorum]|uniref:Class I SAM-dependent methyltransferase n=1 Tax=Candidatus Avoscillospira stercoripullorum TaxID=2840709 RepID=A0A9D1AAU1_9FIRM|nr:class I SAM-dependent methyltransferase [Candidatus Avoscillospira stercoripullorum]
MDFATLKSIQDETQRVQKTYEIFHEDARLTHSQAAQVEFLTTVSYIEQYLHPGDRILDLGAGTGVYSFYFARKGYAVSALELTDANIRVFQSKLRPEDPITLVQGNAMDLSCYPDNSFDVVLLFGPLYHLQREEDKQRCLAEAKRVCKQDGTLFIAFISNDMVFLTELCYDPNYFANGEYNKETFRLDDFPFVFHTVDAARRVLSEGGIHVLHEVASDGASELLEKQINAMDQENFQQYLRYHRYLCEKPEFLGMSNHLLFVGKKERR